MTDRTVTRLCIVQPLLPSYRRPVFDRLGASPGLDLEVWADLRPQRGSLQSVPSGSHFRAVNAPVRRLGPFLWQPLQVRAARARRFDVVIYSWNSRYLNLAPALRAAHRAGIATILWGHGYSKTESPLRRRFRNRLLRLADACLLYNRTAADRLIAEGAPSGRVFVAPNAIDQAPIRAAREHWLARPDELAAFQAARGIAPGNLIAFMSRLEPDKRIDLLLEALARVRRSRSDARLVLIGRGPEQPRLETLAAQLGLRDAVIFAGPKYDDMQIAPWLLSSGVFAYPAAIGLSIFHAFGYGLPVVTSDDRPSHNPEIESLRPGENGLLFRDGDAGDFAARLVACLSDDALRRRLGHEALATVSGPSGFTLEAMVSGFLEAIEAVRPRS